MIEELKKRLDASVSFVFGDRDAADNKYGDWDVRSYTEIKKILDVENKIDPNKIDRFIRDGVYVPDSPSATIKGYAGRTFVFDLFIRLLMIITGYKRNGVNEAKLTFSILEESNMLNNLDSYPLPKTGKPFYIKYKGYKFTNRYLRHIYFLSIFKKELLNDLSDAPIIMDIGSSYGTFSCLIKKLIPNSHHILVELPGQLIIAHYYLQSEFPDARIADITTVDQLKELTTEIIKQYDFILLSTTMYDKLITSDIDVVTNFVSLAEMSKEWFDLYTNSKPFKTAKFLYTANRYDSSPTFSNGITILDYPLYKYKRVLFKTLPILKTYFVSRLLFFTKKKRYSSELFLFIGRKIRSLL